MARMDFSGTEEMMAALFAESERLERKATEMLGAAGALVVRAWQDAIDEAGHAPPGKSGRATGEMRRSVRASKPKKSGEAYVSTIYPHGKDSRGVGNAEKAFILHYGTSKVSGDHFVDRAEEMAGDAAQAAMEEIWNKD